MLGTSSAGTETLKNLVLPGVGSEDAGGHFTIVDNKKVVDRDLGNDFFVTVDDLGKCKAAVVTELMVEMNPDVKGSHVDMSIAEFISKNQVAITDASLIIACDIDNN